MTIQIKKINFKHSFIFFLFCNIVSLPFIKAYNLSISPLVCLLLILIIGVSHGSLDHIKGRKLLKIFQINNIITFYTSYFLLAVTIIILWVLLPTVMLIAFLIIASFHFGKEDTQFLIDNNKLLLIENESFYQSLNVIENNNFLIFGIVLSTLSNIFLFFKKFELRKFTIFFDYFSIIIINMHFSPLIAFTIYFCFLHSIRHSISLITELDQESLKNGLLVFIKKATPLTILTGIFCLIGLYFLNNNYNLDSAILKLIFIGLASLTFPHILLEYLIEKNEK